MVWVSTFGSLPLLYITENKEKVDIKKIKPESCYIYDKIPFSIDLWLFVFYTKDYSPCSCSSVGGSCDVEFSQM